MADEDIFAGRAFAIPYSNSTDAQVASMARAHLVTRTQTPGAVIQVGDKVVPVGVSPFDTTPAKPQDVTAARRFEQLPSYAQEVIARNIAWQYGGATPTTDVAPGQPAPAEGDPMKKSLDASDAPAEPSDLEKGRLANFLGMDHLFPDKTPLTFKDEKPAVAAAKPVDPPAATPTVPAVPSHAAASAEPKRLITTEPSGDEPKRLINRDAPKSLFHGPTQRVLGATPSRAVPEPAVKPMSREEMVTKLSNEYNVDPARAAKVVDDNLSGRIKPATPPLIPSAAPKASPAPAAKPAAAPVEKEPAATAEAPKAAPEPARKPKPKRSKASTPKVTPAPQTAIGVPKDVAPEVSREVETSELGDIDAKSGASEGHSDEGYTGPDHRAVVNALQNIQALHAVHRPGFKVTGSWQAGENGGAPRLISRAHHAQQNVTEEHHLVPNEDGSVTHIHRITMPDRPAYESTVTVPSLDKLHEHLASYFPKAAED